jgi:hypothetical protein
MGNIDRTDILVFIIILTGGVLLIYTFPDTLKKELNKPKVFISGISIFTFKNTEGKSTIEQSQLYPLVRAFHVTSNANIELKERDILHILLTSSIDRDFILKRKEEIEKITKFVRDDENNSEESESVQWFNEEIKRISKDPEEDVKKNIDKFIKTLAKYAFYDNGALLSVIDKLDIRYSKAIDYNNFKDCYDTANSVLEHYSNKRSDQKHDIKPYDIVINCTPGTVTLSSALSILSMADNRRLIYYNQNKEIPISNRMMEIAENKLEFKELIEQVAEDLSG